VGLRTTWDVFLGDDEFLIGVWSGILRYFEIFWDILRWLFPALRSDRKKLSSDESNWELGPQNFWDLDSDGKSLEHGVSPQDGVYWVEQWYGSFMKYEGSHSIPLYPIISHYIEQWYEGSHSIPFIFMPYFSSLVLYPLSFAPLIPYIWGPLCKIHRLQYWEVFPTKNTVSTLGAEYSYQSSDTPESYGWSNKSPIHHISQL